MAHAAPAPLRLASDENPDVRQLVSTPGPNRNQECRSPASAGVVGLRSPLRSLVSVCLVEKHP